ncbi:hypothetical protein K458DRAFT_39452 [Lentithecium fluviatile CBS 122367]|uniref:Uncharacterized protein n=1 Tax=Lentithecium fluviatile CBS 122367 TaxID=1168545 RepID=A0A6G1J093_9PLEO|nr:hypothetical protein K458DRAFT_39452 [Lentithecium fluviatile CBS 122367]
MKPESLVRIDNERKYKYPNEASTQLYIYHSTARTSSIHPSTPLPCTPALPLLPYGPSRSAHPPTTLRNPTHICTIPTKPSTANPINTPKNPSRRTFVDIDIGQWY